MLRTLRDRLTPGEVGVSASLPAIRRVPGLRRDELASIAGVSEEHRARYTAISTWTWTC
jgi:hypothetical protein